MNIEIIIPLLAALGAVSIGGAVLVGRMARRSPIVARLRAIEGTIISEEDAIGSGPGLADLLGRIGKAVASKGSSTALRQSLTQAGYFGRAAAPIFMGTKVLLLAIGLFTGVLLILPMSLTAANTMILIAMAAGIPFFLPNMAVSLRRSKRRGEIERHLPDAIDLLEICASAGMGIDMAWNAVADELRPVSPVLADEMALTNLEIHLGAARADAMRAMANRTGAEELSSLVAILVQSERFGTSIIEALRVFAESMRENRSMHSQEDAEKMAVKLIFPMVLFIFPAMLMVLAGPAMISLFHSLPKN